MDFLLAAVVGGLFGIAFSLRGERRSLNWIHLQGVRRRTGAVSSVALGERRFFCCLNGALVAVRIDFAIGAVRRGNVFFCLFFSFFCLVVIHGADGSSSADFLLGFAGLDAGFFRIEIDFAGARGYFSFFEQRIIYDFMYKQKSSFLGRAASSRSESFFRNPQHCPPPRLGD